jgi:RHS repeat-associated protein
VRTTYDGDVTKLRDANTNYQYTYNADDEVSTFADNGTTGLPLVTLTYSYDGDGNETGVSDSLGGLLTMTYDTRDELTTEQFSGTGLSAQAVTYSYDNAGRLTGITRYSNLAETTEVAATAYSYDHANRMTGIVDSNSTGTTLVSHGYTYDAADRITQEVRTWDSGTEADTLTYSYTNNNQLTGVTHSNGLFSNESFTWDNNGNETGTGYTTGTDNEQTASPGYTYTYDNAGEMTSETQTSTGDVWTYGYDYRGRMVTAVEKTSGGTTLESVTYTYDALDNRIGMDENGTQTWTLYDQGNPIMDFNGSGSLTMRYLWGPTGIVARQTSGGTVSWYLADHLGTVRDLINNSGAIIDHVDFSAFGTVLNESSPTSGDRFTGFAMLERDTTTALNLAVYREENPGTGRWDSQDPAGFTAEDANLFRYVGSGPTNATDAAGLTDDGQGGHLTGSSRPGLFWGGWRPTPSPLPPTDPEGNWTPTEFFGPGSPLIDQTRWGCGGLAAWRAGTPLGPSGMYNPFDIPKMPGAAEYPTLEQAQARLDHLGGIGEIIAIQNPSPDWRRNPGPGNFATWRGGYWEYMNHGGPRRRIIHSRNLPDMPIRTYIVVPR